MTRRRSMAILGLSAVVMALALASTGFARFTNNGTGIAYSRAQSLTGGNTPSVAVSGRNVTISWAASAGGAPPTGYLVKRYDASNVLQTTGSACTGTIVALTCTETGLPAGTWKYTVTPAGGNWRGSESAKSAGAAVASPALSLDQSTVNALPAVLTGQIGNFLTGQTVTYRLDDPSTGTLLTGAIVPTPIPAGGTSAVSVTVPGGTANGTHTIYAIGSLGDQASASVTVARPQIGTSAIAKSAGGAAGSIKQGGTYFIYANASGTGSPPAGLSAMNADASAITTGQTAVALVSGSFTAGGQTYGYRSAQLTANASLSAGSKSYSVSLTDTAGSVTQSSFSVAVDNTAPTASDIQTQNVNTTVGQAQITDTITFTFSEPMEPGTILSGWAGASTPVVVEIGHSLLGLGSNDSFQIRNSADSAVLPFGTVNLGRNDYVNGLLGGLLKFGASGTPSTMTMSGNTVTVVLGSLTTVGVGVTAGTAGGTGTMSWSPSTTPTDLASNSMSSTPVSETGGADKEF